MDPGFAQTRECQLLADLAADIEAGDQEKFTDDLFQFDRFQKLDKWQTTIMVRVKNQIQEQEDDFS
jgi:alpha-soluble NSF attachment protein